MNTNNTGRQRPKIIVANDPRFSPITFAEHGDAFDVAQVQGPAQLLKVIASGDFAAVFCNCAEGYPWAKAHAMATSLMPHRLGKTPLHWLCRASPDEWVEWSSASGQAPGLHPQADPWQLIVARPLSAGRRTYLNRAHIESGDSSTLGVHNLLKDQLEIAMSEIDGCIQTLAGYAGADPFQLVRAIVRFMGSLSVIGDLRLHNNLARILEKMDAGQPYTQADHDRVVSDAKDAIDSVRLFLAALQFECLGDSGQ